MVRAAVAVQSIKLNDEKTAADRVEPQTIPEQKSRCVKKTAQRNEPREVEGDVGDLKSKNGPIIANKSWTIISHPKTACRLEHGR
ncbi:hypothetical protein J7T55_010407 [Diaporthe amygdali]|uniref:uncharacterized protein n=1 Tax=Phomopsis amygdali TaxID=1214568 RepID=UPI0022FE416C|nr:uncharacterized protein J7T55_010407 [Diaporthe amygdali]KAJ0115584.1 hypothetical protein J7T55_010407 [Diaporthe amygdali]